MGFVRGCLNLHRQRNDYHTGDPKGVYSVCEFDLRKLIWTKRDKTANKSAVREIRVVIKIATIPLWQSVLTGTHTSARDCLNATEDSPEREPQVL